MSSLISNLSTSVSRKKISSSVVVLCEPLVWQFLPPDWEKRRPEKGSTVFNDTTIPSPLHARLTDQGKIIEYFTKFYQKNLIICFLPSPVSSSKLCLLVRWASGMQNIFQTKYFKTTAIFAISVKRYISISHAVPVTMEDIFRWSKICIYYWIWFKSV